MNKNDGLNIRDRVQVYSREHLTIPMRSMINILRGKPSDYVIHDPYNDKILLKRKSDGKVFVERERESDKIEFSERVTITIINPKF